MRVCRKGPGGRAERDLGGCAEKAERVCRSDYTTATQKGRFMTKPTMQKEGGAGDPSGMLTAMEQA
jgi:hypothetical protein